MRPQLILSHSPDFESHALREVERFCPYHAVNLAPGVTCVTLHGDLKALLKRWRARPPIYLHHCFPVHWKCQNPEELRRRVEPEIRRCRSFRLQCRALNLSRPVYRFAADFERRLVEKTGTPALRAARQVLSVVTHEGSWLAGLSNVRDNISPWSGGAPALEPDPGRLNRAEPKLMEALDVFRLKLSGGHALDLGSSQGGWSRVLLKHGFQVTAVDPREPDPGLSHSGRLKHLAMTAEEFLEQPPQCFDFLVNDMILWPADSARLMAEMASRLRPGASALMTLKAGCRRSQRNTDHALRILRKSYKIPRLKQLYHNGLELTAWLVRR